MKRLSGIVPPVCIPLTPEFEVDVPSLARLVDFLLDAGVDGLFVLGSTSETAYLPDGHRRQVIETVVARAACRVPVLAGVIDMTTLRVLEHVRTAVRLGCDGVVATAPFYARTHPAEIDRHFRMIAETSDVPVFAYDLPVSVHSKLSADLVLRLAADGVLAGVKDSSGDEAGLRALTLRVRERGLPFSVLTGSELTADSALRTGCDGIVPGLGNVDPHGYVRLYKQASQGNWDSALEEQERLLRLFELVTAGSPERMGPGSSALGAFKAALKLRGVIDCAVTAPPQIPLLDNEIEHVGKCLSEAGLQ